LVFQQNNLAAGIYTLSAVATDFAGASTTNSIRISVGIPRPALGISLYGTNQPAVFFPMAGTNFLLQMTTNLTSQNWVTISNGIPLTGLIITNTPPNAFFRLY
jgi:hypothetical protein